VKGGLDHATSEPHRDDGRRRDVVVAVWDLVKRAEEPAQEVLVYECVRDLGGALVAALADGVVDPFAAHAGRDHVIAFLRELILGLPLTAIRAAPCAVDSNLSGPVAGAVTY